MKVDGITVYTNLADLTEDEARKYIDYVLNNVACDEPLEFISVNHCPDGKIDLDYQFHGEPFERIRRITGYLTGNLTTWNNAKRAEERERVKHNTQWFNSSGRTNIEE